MYSAIIKKDKKKPDMSDVFEGKKLSIPRKDAKMAEEALAPEIMLEKKAPVNGRNPGSEQGLEIDLMMQSSKKKPSLNKDGEVPMEGFNKLDAETQLELLGSRKKRPMKEGPLDRMNEFHKGIEELMKDDKKTFNPKEEIKKEDQLEKTLKEIPLPEKRKKGYLDALKLRMRTA